MIWDCMLDRSLYRNSMSLDRVFELWIGCLVILDKIVVILDWCVL